MRLCKNRWMLTMSTALIVSMCMTVQIAAQVPPAGKYDTTNYPKDRKLINAITNNFDKSFSLHDDYVGIGADGKISYGIPAELQSFVNDSIQFKKIAIVPGTELLRIFNGTTAIKTKIADVVFDSPQGEVDFKVIRADTFIKQKDKWYLVLGQGTNVMTQKEFDEYRKIHTSVK